MKVDRRKTLAAQIAQLHQQQTKIDARECRQTASSEFRQTSQLIGGRCGVTFAAHLVACQATTQSLFKNSYLHTAMLTIRMQRHSSGSNGAQLETNVIA